MSATPLKGVRVLDLSQILSGPFCTMLLADMGAEVVKVERPGHGDPARRLGPLVDGDSAYFMSVNRGKQSITLDLASAEGQHAVLALALHFDVLVENFVPGTMERWGLGYPAIQERNPALVYASISGFGQDGPYAQRPALDIIVQAMGGLMSVTGEPGRPPVRPGASLGDSVAGVFAALAIVSALWERHATGQGQHIDTSMLDCQVTMMENAFSRYFATGEPPGPLGSRHPAATPFQAFAAEDGYFVVALLSEAPKAWSAFCAAIGRPDLAADKRFAGNRQRMEHLDALVPVLEEVFSERSAAHWLERLLEAGVPCGPVNSTAAVAEDPQVRQREMLRDIPHAGRGHWKVANTPFRWDGAASSPAGASPLLGEHTEAVLKRYLPAADVESLRDRGIV